MKKILFIAAALFTLNACSQQNIEPAADTISKPPKTVCGGADCADDRT